MKSSLRIFVFGALAVLTIGCSSTPRNASIDLSETRRFLGREDDVRVDAQMLADRVGTHSTVHLTYQVQNLRNHPIAIDPEVAVTSYDAETRTITISIGAEIPDDSKTLRLTSIMSGEKKSFAASARVGVVALGAGRLSVAPRYVRVKVNYLADTAPFEQIIKGSTTRVSDELFPKWIDSNEALFTNTLPIDWTGSNVPSVMPDIAHRGFGTY